LKEVGSLFIYIVAARALFLTKSPKKVGMILACIEAVAPGRSGYRGSMRRRHLSKTLGKMGETPAIFRRFLRLFGRLS
jgi:hypothetical protein